MPSPFDLNIKLSLKEIIWLDISKSHQINKESRYSKLKNTWLDQNISFIPLLYPSILTNLQKV